VGTGLIFAAVIAIWVAYGVPLLLRRHEEATRGGGVTSFSGALRVLTQRKDEAVTGEPVEVPESVPTGPALSTSEPAATTAETPPRPYNRRAARVAARRRRRVLLTLLTSCAIVGGLSVAGILLPWAAAVPAGLVAVWLVLCRVMVRSEIGRPVRLLQTEGRAERRAARAARRVERRAVVEGEGVLVDTDHEATMVISGQYEDHDPHRRNVMEKGPLPEGALDQQIVNAAAMTTTVGVTLWDPVPVTLPTYVTKPAAPRTVRTIDFGEPAAAEGRAQDSEDGHGESRRAVGN